VSDGCEDSLGTGEVRTLWVQEAERSKARRVGSCESELNVKEQSRCFGPSNSL